MLFCDVINMIIVFFEFLKTSLGGFKMEVSRRYDGSDDEDPANEFN